MTNLSFKKRILKIDLYGKEVQMRFPTVEERREYARNVRGLDTAKDAEKLESKLTDFLANLGLSAEDQSSLYDEDLISLVESLLPSKKK